MKILLYELGNRVGNSIWENSIPDGWIKPTKVYFVDMLSLKYSLKSSWLLSLAFII